MDFTIQEDKLSRSLRDQGFFLGALLHDVTELEIDNLRNSQIFLKEEMLRLNDLFIMCDRLKFLPFQSPIESRIKDIVIPIVRVALEGFFRVRYLFCDVLKDNFWDPDILDLRFSKIVDNFSFEYEWFIKKDGIKDKKLPALQRTKIVSRHQEVKLTSLREDTVKTLQERDRGEDYKLYAFYSYCCFYSHGNLNRGITKEAGLNIFCEFDLSRSIEIMASNYLRSFSIMYKGNPLQKQIDEAAFKSLIDK